MAGGTRTEARFRALDEGAGHYESFYLKASHPTEPRSIWLRYTVHKAPGEQPRGSLWFTWFDRERPRPRAVKQTFDGAAAGGGRYIEIGGARFAPGAVEGTASAEGRSATWDLTFSTDGPEALFHLPRSFMYRAPLPRTKLLSPYPDARFSGEVAFDGEAERLDGWRGMVGHNWGAQHAERWIWMHGADFHEAPEAWLDVALGRIRIGSWTTPWIANGVLALDGERLRLGGIERTRRTDVSERPDGAEFALPGAGITVQGTAGAPRDAFAGWVYADPDGSEHHTVNCSAADMTLTVSRPGHPARTLTCTAGAAYELGMREHDHGMVIEPFPDG